MALRDVNWGAVVLGAAAVTAFVAIAPVAAPLMTALGTAGAVGAAAVTGGVAGEMVSKLFNRTRDATEALVHR